MVPTPRIEAAAEELSEGERRASNTVQELTGKKAHTKTDNGDGFRGAGTEDVLAQSWITDPQNPINWSPLRKWTSICLLIVTNLIAYALPACPRPPYVPRQEHALTGNFVQRHLLDGL